MHLIFQLFAVLVTSLLLTSTSNSADLIVIEQDHCPYCEKFNREIAEAYPNTKEGKIAPLRRLDLHEPWPDDLSEVRVEQMTPTFILVENGQEIDRLVGYPGDEFFWFLLGEMLAKLNPDP